MAKWNPRRARENGDFMPRIADIEADIHKERNKNSTRETTISRGALRVNKGAGVDVADGGSVHVADGGDVAVADGGNVEVSDGGRVNINDGGMLRSNHPNGALGAWIGGNFSPDGDYGNGLAAVRPSGANLFNAFNGSGQSYVLTGEFNDPVSRIRNYATSIQSAARGSGAQHLVSSTGVLSLSGGTQAGLSAPDIRIFATSVSGAANLTINGENRLGWTVSGREFKQDIEDLHINPDDVLKLRPRTWRDKGEVSEDETCDRWHVGFIADELDEIGLGCFVEYDEDGVAWTVHYERLVVALIALAKDQDRRLRNIEDRLEALDGQKPKPRRRRWWTRKPRRTGPRPSERGPGMATSSAEGAEPSADPAGKQWSD